MKQLTNAIAGFALLGLGLVASLPVHAQDANEIEELLTRLADPAEKDWEMLEGRIVDHWSRSGSVGMDLLLQRGNDALESDDYRAALEHFSALTDHAPQFAEGWNMQATVYYLMEEFGLSIEAIQRTLALNPRHFGALNGLGVILEQIDDKANALVAYRAALAINPHRESVSEAIERLERDVDGRTL